MNIIRMLVVKNEADILERNIQWYSSQHIPTVIVDNESIDESYAIAQSFKGRGVLAIEKMATNGYQWQDLLNRVHAIAKNFEPEYLLLADADEFYESPIMGEALHTGLERQVSQGFNLVQFHNMEFWMTEKDDIQEPDFMKRVRHYSYFDSNRYKCYLNLEKLDIATKIGHVPIFPKDTPVNLSPEKFISRHYKFRSLEQGCRKIRQVSPTPDKPDQNFHYVKFTDDPSHFIIRSDYLNKYDDDKQWVVNRTYDGGRMNRAEMMEYLGLRTDDELEHWFSTRRLNI